MDLTRLREIWDLLEEADEKVSQAKAFVRELVSDEEVAQYHRTFEQELQDGKR